MGAVLALLASVHQVVVLLHRQLRSPLAGFLYQLVIQILFCKRMGLGCRYSPGNWYPSFITSIFASTEAWPWERSP